MNESVNQGENKMSPRKKIKIEKKPGEKPKESKKSKETISESNEEGVSGEGVLGDVDLTIVDVVNSDSDAINVCSNTVVNPVTEEDLSSFISDIKESYKKTNIKDLNREDFTIEVQSVIGWLLERTSNESSKIYRINFDPLQMTFLHKMVSEDVLNEKIVVTKDDYFKSVVFIDYLTGVLLNSNSICKTFQKFEQRLEEKNEFLDPDLELIVKYSAVNFATKLGEKLVLKGSVDYRSHKRRFNSKNESPSEEYTLFSCVNPLYEQLGMMVLGLIDDDQLKLASVDVTGRYELKSLIFTDAVIGFLDEPDKQPIYELIKQEKYFKASVKALETLGNRTAYNDIINYMDAMDSNYPNYVSANSKNVGEEKKSIELYGSKDVRSTLEQLRDPEVNKINVYETEFKKKRMHKAGDDVFEKAMQQMDEKPDAVYSQNSRLRGMSEAAREAERVIHDRNNRLVRGRWDETFFPD